jgi:hypothetical protein
MRDAETLARLAEAREQENDVSCFGLSSEEPIVQKRNRIAEQFSPRTVAMQRSPAYRVLNGSELKMLDRIEIELAGHAGKDNGALPVTFDDFVEYGIRRALIAPVRRALVALGFVTYIPGVAAKGFDKRHPNMFGLTYRHAGDCWRKITDLVPTIADG